MVGMMNALPSEVAAILATVDPDALTATTHDSDWVDMGKFDQVLAVVMAGTLGTNATFNAKIQQAQDDQGTGVKDITGKAITELTEAGTDQSDSQALINVRAEELDLVNAFTHIRLRITVGTATSDGGGVLLGFGARYLPVDNDLASVAEIVN